MVGVDKATVIEPIEIDERLNAVVAAIPVDGCREGCPIGISPGRGERLAGDTWRVPTVR